MNFFDNSYNIKPETIYIGGGTPSIDNGIHIVNILNILKTRYSFYDLKECTAEINPEDISDIFVKNIQSTVLNRLSLGIQSFNNKSLETFNRRYKNTEDFCERLTLLKTHNYSLSIDLINYLEFSDLNKNLKSLKNILEKKLIQHISLYDLFIEKEAISYKLIEDQDQDKQINYFRKTYKLIKQYGFRQYEVSNFSIKGNESLHNKAYWLGSDFIGIGAGAHSKVKNKRYISIESTDNSNTVTEEFITQPDLLKEYLLMRFRLFYPLSINLINKLFNIKFDEFFSNSLLINTKKRFIIYRNKKNLSLTEKGKLFINSILCDMFIDIDDNFKQ